MRHLAIFAVQLLLAAAAIAAPAPQVEISEEFVVDAFDGDARLTARHTYTGVQAQAAARTYRGLDAEGLKRVAVALYASSYPGIVAVAAPVPTVRADRVELEARYRLPQPLATRDGYHELRLDGRMMEGARQALAALLQGQDAGGYSGVHRLRIVWPRAVRADDVPHTLTMENPWFHYRRDSLHRGNVTELQAEFAMKPGAAGPGLQDEVRLLGERRIAALGVGAAALLPPSLQDVPYRTAEAYLAARELPGLAAAQPANGCAVLLRALVAGELLPPGVRERLPALAQELARSPERDGVRRCVGETRFAAGDFGGAVGLIDSAAPFPAPHSMNRLHAWALLLVGDRTRAVDTMRRYDEARVAAGSDTVHDLIRHAALLRHAGLALPPTLRARLAARTGPFWPAPVARMQAGLLSQDALLAQAAALDGDSRAFALGEASFYVGVERLAAGDIEGARRAFRGTRAEGVHNSLEYLLAGAELRSLGEPAPVAADAPREALQRAAIDLEPGALTVLGKHFVTGGDVTRGVHYLHQAAALGRRDAQAVLGMALLETAPAEAAVWNGALAEEGDVQARLRIAQQLQRGLGVPKNGERAMAIVRPIAESGNADAEVMLALMYHLDRQDPARAVEWYRKAAAQGKPEALTNLGDMYENGTGVAQDLAQAVALYRQAARLQDGVALASLGSLYEHGKGVAADPALAYTYYLLGKRFGWRGDEAAALERRLAPARAAAAREAAAGWSKGAALPGL